MNAPPAQPMAISATTAANLLGISERTVWRLIKSGEIETVKLGQRRLIRPDRLLRSVGVSADEA